MIANDWRNFGAQVSVDVFETGNLNQNIIRPRRYDALFFGEVIGRDMDLYPFWHSSQRNDPGLNIALYVNSTVDSLVENARTTSDSEIRKEKLMEFENEIRKENPAVFIYSPKFIYVTPKKIKGLMLGQLSIPGERFANIHEWYIETNKIWKIFNKTN
jgi:peptide/nickel transport system substrate-binding protein